MTVLSYIGKPQEIYWTFISIYFELMQYIFYAKKKKNQQKKFATINLKQDGCQQQKLNAIVIQRTVTRCYYM